MSTSRDGARVFPCRILAFLRSPFAICARLLHPGEGDSSYPIVPFSSLRIFLSRTYSYLSLSTRRLSVPPRFRRPSRTSLSIFCDPLSQWNVRNPRIGIKGKKKESNNQWKKRRKATSCNIPDERLKGTERRGRGRDSADSSSARIFTHLQNLHAVLHDVV